MNLVTVPNSGEIVIAFAPYHLYRGQDGCRHLLRMPFQIQTRCLVTGSSKSFFHEVLCGKDSDVGVFPGALGSTGFDVGSPISRNWRTPPLGREILAALGLT